MCICSMLHTIDVLYIITGQGIHSKDKIPKIKPAVENYLKENNYV